MICIHQNISKQEFLFFPTLCWDSFFFLSNASFIICSLKVWEIQRDGGDVWVMMKRGDSQFVCLTEGLITPLLPTWEPTKGWNFFVPHMDLCIFNLLIKKLWKSHRTFVTILRTNKGMQFTSSPNTFLHVCYSHKKSHQTFVMWTKKIK